MYYLKISGYIPEDRKLEFEQTCRLAFIQIPRSCREFHMASDLMKEGVYYFSAYWLSNTSLREFTGSSSFIMLVSSFKVLGQLYGNVYGEQNEQAFDEAGNGMPGGRMPGIHPE